MPSETTRRQRLRYYSQQDTQEAIHDAVYSASAELTIFDESRIVEVLGECLDDYSGPDNRLEFRKWAVQWAARIAKLTALAKPLLPSLRELASAVPGVDDRSGGGKIADAVLCALHHYDGPLTREPFELWANDWTVRTAKNVVRFCEWYEVPEYRKAVRDGVLSILCSCTDLGALNDEHEFSSLSEDGQSHFGVVETLSRDAWFDIYRKIDELVKPSPAPIEQRLKGRARFTAHAWKSAQLDYRKKHVTDDDYIDLENLEKLPDDDPFTVAILTNMDVPAKPVETRHCVKCKAALARWNQSEPGICRPCWAADYYGEDGAA